MASRVGAIPDWEVSELPGREQVPQQLTYSDRPPAPRRVGEGETADRIEVGAERCHTAAWTTGLAG